MKRSILGLLLLFSLSSFADSGFNYVCVKIVGDDFIGGSGKTLSLAVNGAENECMKRGYSEDVCKESHLICSKCQQESGLCNPVLTKGLTL